MAGICDDCDATTVIADFAAFGDGINSLLKIQQGGITGVAFLKCSAAMADETLLTDWTDALDATPVELTVIRSCALKGSKAEASTTETQGACLVDFVSDFTSTITIEDIEDNSTFDRFNFWADVRTRPNDFLIAYWTCQGVNGGTGGNTIIRGFFRASVIATESIDDTKAGKTKWTVVITWHNPIDAAPLDAPVELAFNINTLVTP